MGAALYDSEPHYRDAMDRCAALLEPHIGLDIRAIIFADDSGDLINETRYAQPALFCTEYALAIALDAMGRLPSCHDRPQHRRICGGASGRGLLAG